MRTRLVLLGLLVICAAGRLPAARAAAAPVPPFALARVDPCFFAPSVPGSSGWPLAAFHAPHAVRGSFNEPRTLARRHFGVDVQALRDPAPVYAIAAGRVLAVRPSRLTVGTYSHHYSYWHVRPLPRIPRGARVSAHQMIGWTTRGSHHLHVAEWYAPCGWVDPRRPTGALRTPQNSEPPRIGPISAYAAYGKAFIPSTIGIDPAGTTDPAPRLPLSGLRGKVDFRASVTDNPLLAMRFQPQIPLMVAAIRAYLAPASDPHVHIGPVRQIFDGARLFNPVAGIWHAWARGTYRLNGCYKPWHGRCGGDYVWHVGGPYGVDFKRIPSGDYQFCVQAVTIRGVGARRCAPLTVRH